MRDLNFIKMTKKDLKWPWKDQQENAKKKSLKWKKINDRNKKNNVKWLNLTEKSWLGHKMIFDDTMWIEMPEKT